MKDDKDAPDSRYQKIVPILTTILLGLITVATAWSGFQATKWGGRMSNSYAAASVARSNSVESSLTANQLEMLDIQLFIQWINAINANDTRRAEFYFERMRDEVKPAMEAWLATDPANNPDAPNSPFIMPQYQLQTKIQAAEEEKQAEALTQQALESNKNGDQYVMTTVILASGLFFAGIASLRMRQRRSAIQATMLIMALAAFGYGTFLLASYPVFLS